MNPRALSYRQREPCWVMFGRALSGGRRRRSPSNARKRPRNPFRGGPGWSRCGWCWRWSGNSWP